MSVVSRETRSLLTSLRELSNMFVFIAHSLPLVPYDIPFYTKKKEAERRDMKKILIVTGPTASGKTGALLSLGRSDLEVVSADSRQVYRRLDIGTAKPTPDERAKLPHHLVDVCDPDETYNAGRFRLDAETAITSCLERGKVPVVVGGTGFYLRALVDGLSPIPAVPSEVTDQLRGEMDGASLVDLYRRLVEVDPRAAEKIEPNDRQRILRALAVYTHTGRTLSSWWDETAIPPRYEYLWCGITWPRETLRRRIAARVDAMLDAGLEAEVRRLIDAGYTWETNAMRTVGYREWEPYFAGHVGLDAVCERIVIHSAQYAKRQMTWFRGVPEIRWIHGDSGNVTEHVERCLDEAARS